MRTAWLSIFDKHRLTAGLEHHDHVFTRTKLLRNGAPDPEGTLYVGDGCWGMPARKVDPGVRWYQVKAASLQHFWVVDVSRDRVEYRAISKEGKVFDVYPPDARGAKRADRVYNALLKALLSKPAPKPAPAMGTAPAEKPATVEKDD